MKSSLLNFAVRCVLVATFLATSSSAALLTITFSSTATGTIGNSSFTRANFTITALADSANVTTFGQGGKGSSLIHSSAQIDIAGLGAFDFVTSTRTFVFRDATPSAGFGRGASVGDLLSSYEGASLSTYFLDSSIGPIVDTTTTVLQWNNNVLETIVTSGGILIMEDSDSNGGIGGTFRVVASDSAIPEPATAALILPALFLLARFRKRCV